MNGIQTLQAIKKAFTNYKRGLISYNEYKEAIANIIRYR